MTSYHSVLTSVDSIIQLFDTQLIYRYVENSGSNDERDLLKLREDLSQFKKFTPERARELTKRSHNC